MKHGALGHVWIYHKMAPKVFKVAGERIPRGSQVDIRYKISETYLGDDLVMPIRVVRAKKPGPTVFVTAAIHGDELNGTGIVHSLLYGDILNLKAGAVILAPVVNVFGFESHERYLPDRRDLNRSFPGTATGSLASRYAHRIMETIVGPADFGIDLHSAAFQRTNYPNVRADISNPAVRRLAKSFGCSLILDGKGPIGSFRREACRAGVPTIILEAGEPWKIEPGVLKLGEQGVRNVLCSLGMLEGEVVRPTYQTIVRKTTWVRAKIGGLLKFHISAGDFLEKDQAIATNYSIFGDVANVVRSPVAGIALGMTTMPAVKPGEPICHVAVPGTRIATLKRSLSNAEPGLHEQLQEDLATSFDVIEYVETKGASRPQI